MTSRELVYKTLEFKNDGKHAPRDLWVLPWADIRHPGEIRKIRQDFPSDFAEPDPCYKVIDKAAGDPYKKGKFIDHWGCVFESKQDGYIGEVKEAIVPLEDENWKDVSKVRIPVERLSVDISRVNAQCRASDKFMISGFLARPFEQLQFIRTTEQLMCDLLLMPEGLKSFMNKMHTFYCDLFELWAKTDIDALLFMDDWGSQNALLINPEMWERIFKPLYKDYIDIAHKAGKYAFMHSDGNTLAIFPHLIDLGLDAINSQIFCIGIENLRQFAGKITFWGEIDRQNILPYATAGQVRAAVHSVREILWQNGGAIAQCEFGPGCNPANVRAVFTAWEENR
ncbi:MAG: methyltransferase [Clostridia bacterium]|nr:methyltransferase [Clostridia bacterium]